MSETINKRITGSITVFVLYFSAVFGTGFYEIEECRIPVSPTVVISFPGFGFSSCEKDSHVFVLGASEANRVSFTIPDKTLYPWSHFTLEVPDGVAASLIQSPTESGRYLLTSIGESFGTNTLPLLWRWEWDCDINVGEILPTVITPIDVEARTPLGESLSTDVIPGSFFDWTDAGVEPLWGKVLYSDGATIVSGAEVIIHSIGEIRMDSECEKRWCDNSFLTASDGSFESGFPIFGIHDILPATVRFQAWVPGDCESRTEVMEVLRSASGGPPYRDIILPVPPPPPDPTPTPTEAPSCVDPGRLNLYY